MPRDARGAGGVFVDSGAWIALFSARDRWHGAADAMFRSASADGVGLVTTNLVVAEVHRLLLFRAGIKPASRAVEVIDATGRVDIEFVSVEHHDRARRWLEKLSDQHVTYTDAVSFAVMEARCCRVAMSFDHDFSVAGFDLWPSG